MRARWLIGLLLAAVAGGTCQAQETPAAAFAKIDEALESLKAADDAEGQQQARVQLLEACDAFIQRHLTDGTPEQTELASGYWLDLASRPSMGVEPEQVLARIKRFREVLQPMSPRLERACDLVEANLRIRVGAPGPDWTAAEIHEGQPVHLADQRGKLVLMDFWATWCAPCLTLMSTRLRRLHERYDGEHFVLIGVGSPRGRDTAEKQAQLSDREGFAWLKVYDADSTINKAYGVPSLPFLVLLDEEGKILVYGDGHEVIDQVEGILAKRLGPLIPPQEDEGQGDGQGDGGE